MFNGIGRETALLLVELSLCIFILHPRHVETICLLSKLNIDHHIEVEMNLDEMDLMATEGKDTYEESKAYVQEQTGL